ncbi:MAG: helix-turn-helix transcriptional regulator [Clostridia bacterium]|nr:helix-turn-helix transcriptional regulator [Clostridia bacterium]
MNDKEKYLRKSIGKKIKVARANSKYTQEQLAEKLSLSPRYISQLERGIAFGSASTIINLCNVLHINTDFLFNDLVKNEDSLIMKIEDNKFLESYIKLNDYNKKIINSFTNELIKIQNNDESTKKQKSK